MSTPTAPMDPRLGRRFTEHDPQNLEYRARALLNTRPLQDQDRYWPMPTSGQFPLDQGNSPECTGFGSAHEYALGPVQVPGMNAAFAHQRYLRNVQTDVQAGHHFDGGATVAATMRAAKVDKLITGYVWNIGLDDTIASLVNVGPICLGTDWLEGMFRPDNDGLLTATGATAGGHFWVLAARVKNHHTWGPGCWMVQSWGRWGVGVPQLGLGTGCAFVQDATLAKLLARSGESVVMRDHFDAPPIVEPESARYFAEHGSRVFHDTHKGKARDVGYATYADAVAAGLRGCRVCNPRRS